MDRFNLGDIISKIKNPYSIIALIILVFLVIVWEIVKKESIFTTLDPDSSSKLITYIVDRIFYLVLAITIIAFIYSFFKKNPTSQKEKKENPRKAQTVRKKKKPILNLFLIVLTLMLLSVFLIIFFNPNKSRESTFFYDDFSKPNPKIWDLRTTSRIKTSFGNNSIIYSSQNNSLLHRRFEVNEISSKSEFSLETKIRCIECNEESIFGISWNINTNKESFILLNYEQMIAIGNLEAGIPTYLLDWSKNFNIKIDGLNTLTFKNDSNYSSFFINGIKIGQTDLISVDSDYLSFSIKNATIEITEIKIK